jgi:CHASE2 domain-containing sensor protein
VVVDLFSLNRLFDNPSPALEFAAKVVFVCVIATSQTDDRLFTPFGLTAGTEINAAAFETMAQGTFLIDVEPLWENLVVLGLLTAIGLAFRYLPGWWAYGTGGLLLFGATLIPYIFFLNQRVFPFATSFLVAWLGTLTAASYYHLVVRRNLAIEQASRERYQQAMHFVTHDTRTVP